MPSAVDFFVGVLLPVHQCHCGMQSVKAQQQHAVQLDQCRWLMFGQAVMKPDSVCNVKHSASDLGKFSQRIN